MPDRKYQPTAMLRLQIRLEDFTESVEDQTLSEDSPYPAKLKRVEQQIRRVTRERNAATAAGDRNTAAAKNRELSRLDAASRRLRTQDTKPRAQTEDRGDLFSVEVHTVPVELSVELNSFRIADTMQATFPFRDAPLIPDIIRAALIDVFMGTVPIEDFARPDSWRLSFARHENRMFRGYVDTWESNQTDGDAVVQVQARSLEAILIDAKINPLAPVYRIDGRGEPISAYVNRILSQLPATSGKLGGDQLKAVWAARNGVEPVLDRKLLLRSLQTAKSRNAAEGNPDGVATAPVDTGGTPPDQEVGTGSPRIAPKSTDMSVWDLVVQACELAGCLPVYDPTLTFPVDRGGPGDVIFLRPGQTIYEDVTGGFHIPGGAADGFGPRQLGDVQSEVRFFVWNHNLRTLKSSRKLGRIKAPTIQVVGYNPDAPPERRHPTVRYPPIDSKRADRVGSKGEGKQETVFTKVLNDVRSVKQLEQYAVGLYHAMGRQEMSVHLETDDMASFIDANGNEVHNEAKDLLKMRSGSPIRVTVAREGNDPQAGQVLTSLSEVFQLRTVELTRFLREQNGRFRPGLTPDQSEELVQQVLSRITNSLRSAKLQDLFYVRVVSHRFSAEDGYAASIEAVNFLEARSLPKNLSKDAQAQDNFLKEEAKRALPDPPELRLLGARAEDAVDRLLRGIL